MNRHATLLAPLVAFLFAASVAWGADNQLTPEEKKAGWQLLFNGQDHQDWKGSDGTSIATPIEEGSLLPHKSGSPWIVYEKPFGDFILRCDVKQTREDCNSGIFFRVGDVADPVYSGFEVQVHEGGTGYHHFGAIYDLVPPSKNNVKAPGEWNTVEIKCQGPRITASVNGEVVATMNVDEFKDKGLRPDGSKHKFGVAIKDLPRNGYLGFQDHGCKVYFKNVKLLELQKK